MAKKNQLVALVTPDRKRIELSDAVNLAVRRSAETGQAVGFGGHTITCPYMDVEAGPECYTCENEGGDWDRGPCKLGVPQNADYSFSQRFEDSSRYCDKYQKKEDIKCECGMDQQSAENDSTSGF